MPATILCPNPDCGASYSVDDENLGELGRCEKCGTEFPLTPPTRDGGPPSFSVSDLDLAPKSPEPILPRSFGRYKILRLLGRGGMASVYLALDTVLKRQVALKVPHITAFDRPDVRIRFLREAAAAARFHHPNFCPIFDIGEADGVPYLTMAFIEGKTLSASIERGNGWPPRKAADVVRQLAVSLAELHRQGIVHRDLKPGNIMVNPRGELVIMDFGLARMVGGNEATITQAGMSIGTPAYMPPEQAEGNLKAIGPHSDLYSLGVILYELLTGHLPFEGPPLLILSRVVYVEAPPPSKHRLDLDPALEAICLKAMAKKPDDRHASMDELAGALQSWLTDAPTPPAKGEAVPAIITTKTANISLRLIPAGTFLMGSPRGEGADDERPQHKVTISRPFYLGIYPVTQGQYARLMARNPSHFASTGGGKAKVAGMDTSRFPVENVTWYESVQFCNALSQAEGLDPYYGVQGEQVDPYYRVQGEQVEIAGGNGFRLPTEAEWEYACRAGTSTPYGFEGGEKELPRYAWFEKNSDQRTHVVGETKANHFGLHDMHGNVWEWVWDAYEVDYYLRSPEVDPVGPPQAADRVIRGGSWVIAPRNCRSAFRYFGTPGSRSVYLGFRVARVPSGL